MEEAKRRAEELGITIEQLKAIPASRLEPETKEEKEEIQAVRTEQQQIDQEHRNAIKELEKEIKDYKDSTKYQKYLKALEESKEYPKVGELAFVDQQKKYLEGLEEKKKEVSDHYNLLLNKKEQDLEKVRELHKAKRWLEYLKEEEQKRKLEQKLERERKQKEKEEQKRKEAEEQAKKEQEEREKEEEDKESQAIAPLPEDSSTTEDEEILTEIIGETRIAEEEEDSGDITLGEEGILTFPEDRKRIPKADRREIERIRGSKYLRKRLRDIKYIEAQLGQRVHQQLAKEEEFKKIHKAQVEKEQHLEEVKQQQLQTQQKLEKEEQDYLKREEHSKKYWDQERLDLVTQDQHSRAEIEQQRQQLKEEHSQKFQQIQAELQRIEEEKQVLLANVAEYRKNKAQLNRHNKEEQEREIQAHKHFLDQEYNQRKQKLEEQAHQVKIQLDKNLIEQDRLVQLEIQTQQRLEQEELDRQTQIQQEDLERQEQFEQQKQLAELEQQLLAQQRNSLGELQKTLTVKEDYLAATQIKLSQGGKYTSDSELSEDIYSDKDKKTHPYKSQFKKLGKLLGGVKTDIKNCSDQINHSQRQIELRSNLRDNILSLRTEIIERRIIYYNIINQTEETVKKRNLKLHLIELDIESLTNKIIPLIEKYQAIATHKNIIELPQPLEEYRISTTGEKISIDDYNLEQITPEDSSLYYRNPEYTYIPETIAPVDPEAVAEVISKGQFKNTPQTPKPPIRYQSRSNPNTSEELIPIGQSTTLPSTGIQPSTSYPDPDPSDSSGGSDSDNSDREEEDPESGPEEGTSHSQDRKTVVRELYKDKKSKVNKEDIMVEKWNPKMCGFFEGEKGELPHIHLDTFQESIKNCNIREPKDPAMDCTNIVRKFIMTLKGKARQWLLSSGLKKEVYTVKHWTKLQHKFKANFNPHGSTLEERLRVWKEMKWKPDKQEIDEFTYDFTALADEIGVQDNKERVTHYALAMPSGMYMHVAQCKSLEEAFNKAKQCVAQNLHKSSESNLEVIQKIEDLRKEFIKKKEEESKEDKKKTEKAIPFMFTQDESKGKINKRFADIEKKLAKIEKKKDDTNHQTSEQNYFPAQNFPNPENVYVMAMPSGNTQGPSFNRTNFRGRGGYNPNFRGNNRGGYQGNRGRGGYNNYRQGGRGQGQPNWRQNNPGGNRGGFRGNNRGGNQGRGNGNGNRVPYNPNVTCNYCERVGHIRRDCFTYRRDMQNNGPTNNPQGQQNNNNQQGNNSTAGRANQFMAFMEQQFQDYVQQNTEQENC